MIKLEGVLMDDYAIYDAEQPTRWTQVCKEHVHHFDNTDADVSDCPGEPTCGVAGCNHVAEFYVDFLDCEWDYADQDSPEGDDTTSERHDQRGRDLMAYSREWK